MFHHKEAMMPTEDCNVRKEFYLQNEDAVCNIVRRLRVLASAMGCIGTSSDPDGMRQNAKAAQTLTEDLIDELRELAGCSV